MAAAIGSIPQLPYGVDEAWLRTGKGEMFEVKSPYEKELLSIFSKLTPDTQEFVLEMARKLLEKQEPN